MSSFNNAELFSNQATYLLQSKERQGRIKEAKTSAERVDDKGDKGNLGEGDEFPEWVFTWIRLFQVKMKKKKIRVIKIT